MNKNEFHSYLEHPTRISEDDTSKLKELVDTFPYFQTGHLLYVKGLHNSGDIRYEEQLKMASACVANRKVLYQLVMQKKLNDAIAKFEEDIAETELPPSAETLALPEMTREEKEEMVLATPTPAPAAKAETIPPNEEDTTSRETTEEAAENISGLEENILVEAINSSIQLEVSAYYDINELDSQPEQIENAEEQVTSDTELVQTDVEADQSESEETEPWETEETIVPEELKEEPEPKAAVEDIVATESETADEVVDDGPRTFMEWLSGSVNEDSQNEKENENENEDTSFDGASESEDVVDEQKKKEDLIDKFIAEDPKITPNKAEFFSPVNMAKLSVIDDESFVSETLAKIYAKQGNYAKAIKAYENLSLKYPEKSVYFANLIKSLKTERKQKKKN